MQMLVGTLVFMTLAFISPLTWVNGTILLVIYGLVMAHAVRAGSRHKKAFGVPERIEGADPLMPWWKILSYLGLGLVGLPLGAHVLVASATAIARSYDISETVIGLTLVAVGTSLPELATTIAAAYRRQADVAIGNVIGSNMANLLGIVGVSALFGKIPVSAGMQHFDLWVMLAASVALAPFVLGRLRMGRLWGALFTALYVAYVMFVLH